ncbi:MAG: DUF885 domain-containing protein [Flavobacteriaceae bacterium]|nr:DUF885 domain-containing protein [Flavobacteriaceae bacterium]
MKIKLLLIFFLLLSCDKFDKDTSVLFNNILEDYYQESLSLYKINATYQGDNRYNDTLPNFLSSKFEKKEKQFYTSYLNKINEFKNSSLSDEDLLSKKILIWDCEIKLKGMEFPKKLIPVDQMWGFQLSFGQLASSKSAQPFKTVQDYRNWLIRIDGYLEWLESAQNNMVEGIKIGWVLPKSLIKKVLPQLKVMTLPNIDNHLFYSPVKAFPDSFSQKEKKELEIEYRDMVLNKIIPAYKKIYDFMSNEYMDSARTTSGYSALNGGLEYYKHAIKYYTTTNLTADEIHLLGIQEVERIGNEMKKIKENVGFDGTLKEFFEYVRTLEELMPFNNPQQVIDNFNSIHDKMLPQVNKLFELQPKTKFEVRRTESFREASASAEYNPGSLDGTRPGIFYVPIPNVEKYNFFSDEDLFLHEAIPGHHFQISLQQENNSLPSFRKNLWYSSYGEGWALYSESLGKELGLYDNQFQYFGMLGAEMHRAIRLVVDTGLHAKGWSREKAIKYSLENEAESEASIISEIERYMANPGQALSYKIGQLKIQELRKKAEVAFGDKFDIRVFHRKILESGSMPLQLLEDKIDKWIDLNE